MLYIECLSLHHGIYRPDILGLALLPIRGYLGYVPKAPNYPVRLARETTNTGKANRIKVNRINLSKLLI